MHCSLVETRCKPRETCHRLADSFYAAEMKGVCKMFNLRSFASGGSHERRKAAAAAAAAAAAPPEGPLSPLDASVGPRSRLATPTNDDERPSLLSPRPTLRLDAPWVGRGAATMRPQSALTPQRGALLGTTAPRPGTAPNPSLSAPPRTRLPVAGRGGASLLERGGGSVRVGRSRKKMITFDSVFSQASTQLTGGGGEEGELLVKRRDQWYNGKTTWSSAFSPEQMTMFSLEESKYFRR